MLPRNPALQGAADWLRIEALRYVTLAQEHTARAELMAVGTHKIPVNPRRRDDFHRMAVEAARIAEQFLVFAIAVNGAAQAEAMRAPLAPTDIPDRGAA